MTRKLQLGSKLGDMHVLFILVMGDDCELKGN